MANIRLKLTNLIDLEIVNFGIKDDVSIEDFRNDIWNGSKLKRLRLSNSYLHGEMIRCFSDFEIIQDSSDEENSAKQVKRPGINLSIEELLKKQTDLEHIDISGNYVTSKGLGDFCVYLKQLPNLKSLKFPRPRLSFDEEIDFKHFASKLEQLTELESLDISGNYSREAIDDKYVNFEDLECIITAIGKLSNLKTLNFSCKFRTKPNSTHLIKTLENLTKLTSLNIKGWINTEKAREELRRKFKNLKEFYY